MTDSQLAVRILTGASAGRVFQLSENAFIGSQLHCEIQLTDDGIAPLHARISLRGDNYTLIDLTDQASVKVNNRVIKSRKLVLGDNIVVGETAMEIVDMAAVLAAAPVPPPDPEPIVLVSSEHMSKKDKMEEYEEELDSESLLAEAPQPKPRTYQTRSANATHQTRSASPSHQTRSAGMTHQTRSAGATHQTRSARSSSQPHPTHYSSHSSQTHQTKTIITKPMRPSYYRPEQAIHDHRSAVKATRYVMLGVVIALLVLCGALLSMYRGVENKKVLARYQEAVDFAKAHPTETARIIARYRAVRPDIEKRNAKMAANLGAEISKLEAQVEQKERDFRDMLHDLDEKAQALASTQSFAQALKVYEVADPELRDRVAEARQPVMDDLKKKALDKNGGKPDVEVPVEKPVEPMPSGELKLLLAGIGDSIINGKSDAAVVELEKLASDPRCSAMKTKFEEAIVSAKRLALMDKTLLDAIGSEKGGRVTSRGVVPDFASALDGAPAFLKVVYAVRADDTLGAQTQLSRLEGTLLYESLKDYTAGSDQQAVAERQAARKLGEAWRKVFDSNLAELPKPTESVTQLDGLLKGPDRERALKACSELDACRKDFADTKVIKDYAELFFLLEKAGAKTVTKTGRLGDLGDGNIIQVDGDTYYVETSRNMSDVQDSSIALCKEEMVYVSLDGKKPLAAWVDIYSVLPFRVISEQQLAFSLMAGRRKQTPAVGDCVLIGKELQTGRRFVTSKTSNEQPTLVYDFDADKKWNETWRSASPTLGLDNGRLSLDVSGHEQKPKPGESDLSMSIELGGSPIELQFDVTRKPDASLRVMLGDIEFLFGEHEGRRPGIYASGKLAKSVEFVRPVLGVAQHISITKARTFTKVVVNKTVTECPLSPASGESQVKGIAFFNGSKLFLDNVQIRRLTGTGEASVVAISSDGKEVIVSRGNEAEWDAASLGKPVYFFSGRPNDTAVIAEARIKEMAGQWFVCAAPRANALSASSLVSLTPTYPETPVEAAAAEMFKPKRQSSDLLYAFPKPGSDASLLGLETSGAIPDSGFICPVVEKIMKEQSGEVLSVLVGDSVKCDFKQEGGWINCRLPEGAPSLQQLAGKGALVSRTALLPNKRFDVPVYSYSHAPSAVGAKKDFWKVTNGEWKEKLGRFIGSPAAAAEGSAVITMNEAFGECGQCDFDIRIEKEGAVTETMDDDWFKDVFVEAFFPARQVGVTLGIGAGKDGGIFASGHCISQEKGAKAVSWPAQTPQVLDDKPSVPWEKGGPALKVAQSYNFRIRRVRDAVAFYINGKRVLRAQDIQFDGDMQVRIAVPKGTVSIGKVAGMELPRSIKSPDKESILGDFGYVLAVDGGQLLVDSDTDGMAPGLKVSIMAVDKVVKGEKSTTVFLKRAAVGAVSDVGPRTSKVTCTEQTVAAGAGMKVMRGILPAELTLTDSRLQDIDQGL